MRLSVFISLLIVASASASYSIKDIKQANETYFFPCFTKLQCTYFRTPEYGPMEKCVEMESIQDFQTKVNFLDVGNVDVTKLKHPLDDVIAYYCKLDESTPRKKFNTILNGYLQFYQPDCAEKNGAEKCQHLRDIFDCAVKASKNLYDSGKCDA